MKILAVSDIESKALWDYFDKSRLEGIDVIVSCGDLKAEYLSFLATFFYGPVLYVHGNHDESYEKKPPEGCICIEDQVFVHQGVRFLGLGGSMRYKPGPFQYTDRQMSLRAVRLWPKIAAHHGFDVLVTHAPAFGQGDAPTPAHQGFKSFLSLMDRYSPRVHLHGHVHLNYDPLSGRVRRYQETTIINAYEKYVFELP
ncbi:MAG TPA: metallophosphoesterase family protein [Candidatus Copromonas faecavium]|uniref:Metallophosphoesterase family protein n=1 Tax=Candidatus Copromonas faecavium (nom. illeg.) TaxID=2840740 RepID=A0A9D1A7W2_9FIRM|nr:metallophosphoesterase family protein [Candidatus Copromonas faecavium]